MEEVKVVVEETPVVKSTPKVEIDVQTESVPTSDVQIQISPVTDSNGCQVNRELERTFEAQET